MDHESQLVDKSVTVMKSLMPLLMAYGFINEIHGQQTSGNIHGPLILFSQNK